MLNDKLKPTCKIVGCCGPTATVMFRNSVNYTCTRSCDSKIVKLCIRFGIDFAFAFSFSANVQNSNRHSSLKKSWFAFRSIFLPPIFKTRVRSLFFFYIFEWHFFTLLHECFKLETSLKTNFQFIWWNKKKWIFSCEIFKENCCEFFVKKKLLISSERELPFLGCFFSTTIASHVRHDKS